MTLTIRVPGPADADRIAELHVAAWRETYTHLLPEGFFTPEFVRGRHAMWHWVLDEPREGQTVRVAEVDGELVGVAFAGPSMGDGEHPRARHLYSIYVLGAWHGSGAGQALLDETLGDAPAMLWVAKQNPRAIAFYRRNGFAFDGTEQIDPMAPAIIDARMLR